MSINDFKSSNFSGELSIAKQYGRFRVRMSTSGNTPPTLPDVIIDYTFTDALYWIDIQGRNVALKFPKANAILTEYCRECLPVYCTLAFFEMFNKQFSPGFIPCFTNEKLESAVSLYKTLYFMTDTTGVKTILSYYLDNPLNFTGSLDLILTEEKLTALRNSLKDIEERYKTRLYNEVLPTNVIGKDGKPLTPDEIKWFNEKKAGKILSDEAITFFIGRANYDMLLDIEVEFSKNQVRTTNFFYADPITSDPRLRMSLEDARWNEYDDTIKKEVAFYNQKFAGVANFAPLDWRYVKAMVWTEVLAGPDEKNGQWQEKPMRIGVKGDPSLKVVSNTDDDADLIVSADRRNEIRNNHFGHNNIIAGIAALYYKAIEGYDAKTDPRKVGSRDVPDNIQALTYVVQNTDGKGVDDIAKRLETTRGSFIKNTPELTSENINQLLPGQVLKYQKAHTERYITGWRDWTTTIRNYNKNPEINVKGGDPNYMDKVLRAYQIITSRTPQ